MKTQIALIDFSGSCIQQCSRHRKRVKDIIIAPRIRPELFIFVKNGKAIAKQFTLGKNERLKSRKLIERVFREGKNFAFYPYRVYYINGIPRPGSLAHPVQFGVGIGKKNFKKAVDRNRIKRLTREAYRLQKKILQESARQKDKQLALFLIYTGKELPEYDKLYEKIGVILKKMVTITHENNADPA